MLTLIESISLAGDRKKQNDDALGFSPRGAGAAWVIDGATDLHGEPLTFSASDASWVAQMANYALHAWTFGDRRAAIRQASEVCASGFTYLLNEREIEPWQSPIASLLMAYEDATGDIYGVDLGDCRMFAQDADGMVHVKGGAEGSRDAEARAAAKQKDADKPLLERTATIEMLRNNRASLNKPGAEWTFGVDPACAEHARLWEISITRPAHLLLMTDGFAVLADQYGAYDPAGLVRAAIDKGLEELGRELRAIERADAAGAKHPRFKASDDATALLMRLT
jgi:hypothetical protein